MDILIRRATAADAKIVAEIGRVAVELAHRDSCSTADMELFLTAHYNETAILNEVTNPDHIYNLIFCDHQPAGFSKIILNAEHPNIPQKNVTKLDRIYLLPGFYGKQLGAQLLAHNVALSHSNDQCGMWLFTWTGNEQAVHFYKKNGFTIIGDHRFKISETHYNPNHHMLLSYGN